MPRRLKAGSHNKKKRGQKIAALRRRRRPKSTAARRKSGSGSALSIAQELQATLDSIPALAWRARADGFTEYLNRRWLDYTGVSLEQALGWQWLALIHPDDVLSLRNVWLKGLESGGPGQAEARMRRSDGVYRWFLIRAEPSLDATGAVVAWYGTNTDVDELKATEIALRQNKTILADAKRSQEALDLIPTLAWRARADGFLEFLNRRWLDYTGLTLQQALGWEWTNAIYPDDRDGFAATWRALLVAAEPGEVEARLRRFDGTYRWFLFRMQPVHNASGSLVAWYGTNDDIEPRKRVETELRINEQRYRELFNYVPVGLAEIDAQKRTEMLDDLHRKGVTNVESYLESHPDFERLAIDASIIKEVNQHTVEMLGAREAGELVGMSTARLLTMSPDALRRGTVSRFRGEKLFQHELKVETLAGRTIDVLLTVARPDVSRNFIALTDITKRKAMEEALRDSEEQWKAAFENNPIMYFIVDAAGTILSVNAFGAEQLGYTPDELIGRPVQILSHEADREAALRNKAFCLEHLGQTMSWELRKLRKDGKVLWVRETARAMLIKNRPVALVVSEDVTERKHAADALREAQMELAHANRVATMGQLTASIAHEVSQPVAAARNNASAGLNFLDLSPPDLEEVRQALRCVVNDTNRASDILGRIREHIKKAPPRKESFDLNEAIREVIALVRSEMVKSGVLVEQRLTEGLSPVRADRVQLQQVMLNLILNAVDAMNSVYDGPRELLVSSEQGQPDGAVVTVRDSGPGIDPKQVERIFEAFYTTKSSGVGMGLSICRSIIDAHGGRLCAEANKPKGAVFRFTLPADKSDS
jgi:PAS domain S-box-containing protein